MATGSSESTGKKKTKAGKSSTSVAKRKVKIGRPSTYKPEYCQMLIDHMAEGFSFETFAAKLDYCSASNLYNWVELHPAFSEAKKVATQRGQLFWEQLARAAAAGKIKNFNSTVWIFTMKNRFGWRDKHDIKAEVREVKEVIHQVEIGLDGDITKHRLEKLHD